MQLIQLKTTHNTITSSFYDHSDPEKAAYEPYIGGGALFRIEFAKSFIRSQKTASGLFLHITDFTMLPAALIGSDRMVTVHIWLSEFEIIPPVHV